MNTMRHSDRRRDISELAQCDPVRVIDLHDIRLDLNESERQLVASHLSEEEQARADRFVFDIDRHRFQVGRGRLREILSNYVGMSPAKLLFAHGDHGKPRLDVAGPVPHFNLSHSGDRAALAVCWDVEVGVDIEMVRPIERGLARRFFGAAEIAALAALPDDQWLDGFFRCWTRKEAVLKATGVGLSFGLSSFDVSIADDQPPELLRLDGDTDVSRHWSLFEVRPDDGIIVAVAALMGRQWVGLRKMKDFEG